MLVYNITLTVIKQFFNICVRARTDNDKVELVTLNEEAGGDTDTENLSADSSTAKQKPEVCTVSYTVLQWLLPLNGN